MDNSLSPATRREQIVAAARSFVGTPFQHQGRIPGKGLDCAGVIIVTGNECGIDANFHFTAYSHFPRPEMVRRELTENLDPVPGGLANARSGDVAWLADGGYAVHMGIIATVSGYFTIIHSSKRDGGVIESRIDKEMARNIRGMFSFRGLE